MAERAPYPIPRKRERKSIKQLLDVSNVADSSTKHYYQVTLDNTGEVIAKPSAPNTASNDTIYVNMNCNYGRENKAFSNSNLDGPPESIAPPLPPILEQTSNEDDDDPVSSPATVPNFNMNSAFDNELYETYEGDHPPSPDWAKNVVYISCLIYLIFVTMFSIVIYSNDALSELFKDVKLTFSNYLNLVLSIGLLSFLVFVHVDVSRFISFVNKTLKIKKNQNINEGMQMRNMSETNPSMPEEIVVIPEHYGFTSGRHAGSGYLKLSIFIFYFGHLLHLILNLAKDILDRDTSIITIILSALKPMVSTYILYFTTSYSNLIVNRFHLLWKFGLFHCITSSICFWISAIVDETILAMKLQNKAKNFDYASYNSSYHKNKYMENPLNVIDKIAPYFYPFTIEFNILMVSIWIMMLENLGKVHLNAHKFYSKKPPTEMINPLSNINIDCSHTKGGMFVGLIINVGAVVSLIFFFTLTNNAPHEGLGEVILWIFELLLILLSIGASVWAMRSVLKLDLMKQPISLIEDICLVLCLPSVFLFTSLSVVPHYNNDKWAEVIVDILVGLHPIIQTILITIGLRRCSSSESNQDRMPGRQIIILLILCNIALWIIETFQIKNKEGNAIFTHFYGTLFWTASSHATLPLLLFYYFHSSVCLADIWKSGYQAEQH